MAVLLLPTPRLGWRVMPGFMPGIHDFLRHARPCAGHPRLRGFAKIKDVEGRDVGVRNTPSFGRLCPAMTVTALATISVHSRPRLRGGRLQRESRATTSKFAICCAGSPLSRGRTEPVGAPAQPLHCHARLYAGHPRLRGFAKVKDVDGRAIGVRKHAVLRTAMPGHDVSRCRNFASFARELSFFRFCPISRRFRPSLHARPFVSIISSQ